MNKHHFATLALAASAALMANGVHAQELATVISTMPILEQVQTPAEVCVNRQVAVQQEKSGGGAVIGAIAGGAVGNAIGQGSGNALATAIGLIGGAVLGDRIEGSPGTEMQTVRDCHTEMRSETRVRAYRVVYEYAGKRYEIETAKDPGKTIPINVSPAVPLSQAAPAVTTTVVHPTTTIVRPATRFVVHPPVTTHIALGVNNYRPREPEHRIHRRHHPRDDDRRDPRDDWRH